MVAVFYKVQFKTICKLSSKTKNRRIGEVILRECNQLISHFFFFL